MHIFHGMWVNLIDNLIKIISWLFVIPFSFCLLSDIFRHEIILKVYFQLYLDTNDIEYQLYLIRTLLDVIVGKTDPFKP